MTKRNATVNYISSGTSNIAVGSNTYTSHGCGCFVFVLCWDVLKCAEIQRSKTSYLLGCNFPATCTIPEFIYSLTAGVIRLQHLLSDCEWPPLFILAFFFRNV